MIRYLVVTEARSGSNYLAGLMRNHGQIRDWGEIIDFDGHLAGLIDRDAEDFETRLAELKALRFRDPATFLNEHVFRPRGDEIRATGFKIFTYQPYQRDDWHRFWSAIRDDADLRIIFLLRPNSLRRFVSLAQAMESGVWFVGKKDRRPVPPRVHVDMAAFEGFIAEQEEWRENVRRVIGDHATLEIDYGALVGARDETMDRVWRFLGVDRRPVSTGVRRQNYLPFSYSILNYDEVRGTLERRGKLALLDDREIAPLDDSGAGGRAPRAGGAVCAKEPSRGPTRLFCHIDQEDADILPHFMRHYVSLDVGSFHFVVHGSDGLAERVRDCQRGAAVVVESFHDGAFEETEKCALLTEAVRRYRGEWVLVADADEFLELPFRDLSATVRALNACGQTALPASLLDRIAGDGELSPVAVDDRIEDVFPYGSELLAGRMGAKHPPRRTKFPLFLVGEATNVKPGHHTPPNDVSPFHVDCRAVVHHFKWRAASRTHLDRRTNAGGNTEERAAYRDWLERHDSRLPTEGAFRATRQALFDRGLLRRPDRRALARLVTLRRRARVLESGGDEESVRRLWRGFDRLQAEWDRSAETDRALRPRAEALLTEPAKIALVTFELVGPTRTGGIGTAVGALAERLAADGHDVHAFFWIAQSADLEANWYRYWASRGVTLTVFPWTAGRADGVRRSTTEVGLAVLDWLRKGEFEIIHFHDCLGLGAAALQARQQGLALAGTTAVVTTHGTAVWHKRGNFEPATVDELLTGHAESTLLRLADHVVSPSRYMLDWLGEAGQSLPDSAHVLPNLLFGETRGFAAPSGEKQPIEEFVFFGRIEIRKGIDIFQAAIEKLVATGHGNFAVTLLGRAASAATLDEIRMAASRWPVRFRHIENLGNADAIRYLREGRRLAVMPSRVDNLPYTVYECLDNGIPFVAAPVGGVAELIAQNDRRDVLRAGDADALAATLEAALTDGHAPARLAFDPEEVALKWIAWHGDLKNMNRARRSEQPTLPDIAIGLWGDADRAATNGCLASLAGQTGVHYELHVPASAQAGDTPFDDNEWRRSIRVISPSLDGAAAQADAAASPDGSAYLLFCHHSVVPDRELASTFVRAAMRCGADVVACGYRLQFAGATRPETDPPIIHAPGGPKSLVPFRNLFGAPVFLISRDAWQSLGGFSTDPWLAGFETWDLFNRATLEGLEIASIPLPLADRYVDIDDPSVVPSERAQQRLLRPFLAGVSRAERDALLLLASTYVRVDQFQQEILKAREARARAEKAAAKLREAVEKPAPTREPKQTPVASERAVQSPPSPPPVTIGPAMPVDSLAAGDPSVAEQIARLKRRIGYSHQRFDGLATSRRALLRQFVKLNLARTPLRRFFKS